ncbi:UBX domain-containing protein 5 [Candida viswanathii]|uniref:UBX domain-containing protein 5 n=1 Tax=Candida viswanathii TaxID=5486 RepID=A0A367XQ12_9ASCO|nr:UBX domain-containing protein 5 [Candida viswanathii]
MDEHIPTFLAVTGVADESIAKQFLDVAGGDLETAVMLYMESGQHGGGGSSATNHNDSSNVNSGHASIYDDDEEMAKKLQEEAYRANDDVREADANVHRHETLVDTMDGYQPHHVNTPMDFLGNRRQGIFNQGIDFDRRMRAGGFGTAYDDDDDDEVDDDDGDNYDDEIQILDSDEEEGGVNVRPISRRRQNIQSRNQELSSTQRRLANLFRPPFDIIENLNLDQAKQLGRETKKWILINIQDSLEFQCQVMNRDFFSNERVKQIIKDNFIFLQFQLASMSGQQYVNFYHADEYPHLAILDPLTGERVHKWKDGQVPVVNEWIEEVYKFLDTFSLNPQSNNPLVHHEAKIDPTTLSEEQQIELAMKQSIIDNGTTSKKSGNTIDDAIVIDGSDEEDEEPEIVSAPSEESAAEMSKNPFDAILPIDHPEPTEQPMTRIQIRFPNGKRLVRKLRLDDKVIVIYEWLKFVLLDNYQDYGLSSPDEKFNLSNSSDKSFKFIESLDKTIAEANLKNASILLEQE